MNPGPADESNAVESVADGLMRAIQAETDGASFYSMAAKSCADPKGKQVFETLSREEQEHARFLKAHYQAFVSTGRPAVGARLGPRQQFEGASPIFSEAIKHRLPEAQLEMSALSIGIQLELSSITYYKLQAETVAEPEVQRFYRELVEWETGHYHALLRQQDELKSDFWSAGGFSPF